MKVQSLSTVLLSFLLLGQSAVLGKEKTERFQVEIELPKGGTVRPRTLCVSSDGRFIVYAVDSGMEHEEAPAEPAPVTFWLVEAKGGNAAKLSDLLPESARKLPIQTVALQREGSYALVYTRRQEGETSSIFVIDLKARSGKKLASDAMPAIWVGSKIALWAIGPKGLERMRLVDPKTGTSRTLPMRGIPMASSGNGRILFVAGNPAGLSKPVDPSRFEREFRALLVTPTGKILRDLAKMNTISERPVMSIRGGYVAFQQRLGRDGKPFRRDPGEIPEYSVRVASARPGKDRTIGGLYLALGVTDGGEVITRKALFGPLPEFGAEIHIWDAKGKSRVLVQNAGPGTVVGDRLFYVTLKENDPGRTVIRSAPIKTRPSQVRR